MQPSDVLRVAERPLTTREIAGRMFTARGVSPRLTMTGARLRAVSMRPCSTIRASGKRLSALEREYPRAGKS